ncbi:hypothetical protein EJB05_05421, partial [Eragrostis curvula]
MAMELELQAGSFVATGLIRKIIRAPKIVKLVALASYEKTEQPEGDAGVVDSEAEPGNVSENPATQGKHRCISQTVLDESN